MKPLRLAPNALRHQYRGGRRIALLRDIPLESEFQPEEWLGSTNGMFHHPELGLARTVDGVLLRDLVATEPLGWLGPEPAAVPGDVGFLFKLLDPEQRLPVHVHPDRRFARQHLDSCYGKTEAWLVLDAPSDAAFHLGWTRSVDANELVARRERQDARWMLDRMHRIPAWRGTAVVVPAGQVHAIDAGILLAEIQEPTDLSIVIEWSATTLGRDEAELGLGWDLAQSAISHAAMDPDEVGTLVTTVDLDRGHSGAESVLAPVADPFFSLMHVVSDRDADAEVAQGVGVALVLEGDGVLDNGREAVPCRSGDVFAVPHDFGDWQLVGQAKALVAGRGRRMGEAHE